MGLKKSDLSEETPKFSYLGSWYANLIYIGGRKCVVFTNGKTLFNFIATDVSRAEIRELDSLCYALPEVIRHLNRMPLNTRKVWDSGIANEQRKAGAQGHCD
jgi:hypothetical protein